MKKLVVVGLLAAGPIWLLTRGLPGYVTYSAAEARAGITAAKGKIDQSLAELDTFVQKDPGFLGKTKEVAASRKAHEARKAALDKRLAKEGAELKTLVDEGEEESQAQIEALTEILEKAASNATKDLDELRKPVKEVYRYKTRHATILDEARKKAAAAELVFGDPTLPASVKANVEACPQKRDDLSKRYKTLKSLAGAVKKDSDRLEASVKKDPPDYAATGRAAKGIRERGPKVESELKDLRKRLEEVAHSKDRILVDLRDGEDGRFMKVKEVVDGKARKPAWEKASFADFRKHENHLGMSIYSKPACEYAAAAVEEAIPPGYAYVGKRKYGYWDKGKGAPKPDAASASASTSAEYEEDEGGGGVWRWWPAYVVLGAAFWGSRYSPIRYGSYRTYRTTLRAGRHYYGPRGRYGPKGSLSRSYYKRSTYAKQKRTRAAKAKRSAAKAKRSAAKARSTRRSSARSRTSRGRRGK